MSNRTQEIAGWGFVFWGITHFDLSVTATLDNMREHGQDMAFLSDADAQDKLSRLTLIYLYQKQVAKLARGE
jgi:hypothetical protein